MECGFFIMKKTKEQFIKDARQVHDDKYVYTKVEYLNCRTKVCIICQEHGEFWQTPSNHLSGQGCPMCGRLKVINTTSSNKDEFIEKAKKVHGDKYDYSKVEYINNHTNVCIICPEHSEFRQTPHNHLQGRGCKKCAKLSSRLKQRLGKDLFINKSKEVHGDKYDYSKVKYINNRTNICIICPIHGEFWQTPSNHLSGQGCPKCVGKNKTTNDFINVAKEIHGNKYNYTKAEYINTTSKICIICPIHGEFWQVSHYHLQGNGCPKCNFSNLEKSLYNFFNIRNINFEPQKHFEWLGNQSLDFYIPEYNVAIECQGEQHFNEIKHFGGINKFKKTQLRDKKKKQLCKENGIKLLYYTNIEGFSEFLGEELIKDEEKLLEKIKNKV